MPENIPYKDIIELTSAVFTAIGTVGAVIVALWLGYKDSKPKLRVYANVGIISPDNKANLWLSCTNVGKQNIVCTGFSFKPYKFHKKALRIALINKLNDLPQAALPKTLEFSEKLDQYFHEAFFRDPTIKKMLSNYKWLAKLQLKFCWRIIANTNIKEFQGKLSNAVIEKILTTNFNNTKKINLSKTV